MNTIRLRTGRDMAVIPGGPGAGDRVARATDERRSLRVLVIDDDEEDAGITQRALAEIPWFLCMVDCAYDYASALQLMRTNQYDVILLDHGLGARNGLELLEEAFGSSLNVAVVLLTGMASHQVDEAATRAGIAHLLEKSELRAGPLERSVRYAMERTRIEQELRSTRAFFHSAFDAMSDHVAILDEHGHIMEVNQAWQQFAVLNQYAGAHAGRGESYLRVCDAAAQEGDETATAVADGLRQMLAGTRESFALLYPCHAPGEERWFNVEATRVLTDGAQRVMVAHKNVTERLRSERALRESEEQYRTLVELSPDGILIQVDGTIVFANGSAARILHAENASALVGRTMTDFVHPESAEVSADRLARLARGESVEAVEIRWNTVEGQARDMEVSCVSVDFGGRRAVHTVFRDTTVNRQLEAQLRQSQKMEAVGQLAGGVAHDFNNLLTVIKASVEFLLEDETAAPQYRADVIEVRDAADRAAALTRQLLAFSRTQMLERRVLDVNAVIISVQPMLARLIREDVALRIALAPNLNPIEADPGQVEQVVLNLALNARDAMPQGGLLSIETREVHLAEGDAMEGAFVSLAGAYVEVAVTDTGTGIPPDVRARLFEPFFTTKPVGYGTGLGLATVHGIVLQSGGYLNLDTTIGLGTTFRIFLPVVARALQDVADAGTSTAPRGSETVLVVEDMDAVRDIACRVLTEQGYTVLSARNGREALERAARESGEIHLLLTDVVMPEMNGVHLASALARVRPALEVLFMSGYAEDADTRRAIEDVRAGFVPKPFSPAVLLQRVRKALDAVKSRPARR